MLGNFANASTCCFDGLFGMIADLRGACVIVLCLSTL